MPPAAFRMGSPTASNTEDTELQVVVVGAGRSDLVAQTKVGPGREKHRWGWNAAHQMGRISQEISKKTMKDVDFFSTSKHQRSLVLWNMAFMFHFINMGCHPKPIDFHIFLFFLRWLLHHQPGSAFWYAFRNATEPSVFTRLEVVGQALKRWDFLPKKTGLSSLENHEFPRS